MRQVHVNNTPFLCGVAVAALPCSGILGKDSAEHKWGRVDRGFLSLSQVWKG